MPIPKNPNLVAFQPSPDHELVTGYVLTFVDMATGVGLPPIKIGKPPLNEAGECQTDINVQPVKFGEYFTVAQAEAAGVMSDFSDQSNKWARVPGRPGAPRVG